MKIFISRNKYLIPGRLADVIALISILSLDKVAYRDEKSLRLTLGGLPDSSWNWFRLARQHPEFFRFNLQKSHIVLLLRAYRAEKINVGQDEVPVPLSITETQKLIDLAYQINDRELARSQRYNYFIPSLIGGFFTILTVFLTLYVTNPAFQLKINTFVQEKVMHTW